MAYRRCACVLALLLLVALPLPAQTLQIEDYTLPNGLRVVLNPDRSTPLVAVNIWYHVGSANERPGRTGFAHLFEHMLFSGSQHVGNNEHFRYVQSVGGLINGSTTFDRTNYYETMPANYLPLALWLESDRMGWFLPALDQQKLDIQKNVVKEERRQRYDNVPYGTWIEDQLRLLFPSTHPYSWPTIGSMADLTAAELDDVREFFRTYYAPNNAVLTLVGDFDVPQARTLIQRYFGPIPRGPAIPRIDAKLDPLGGEKRRVIEAEARLPRLYRMYRIPPVGTQEWMAADLLTNILALGKDSRLERSLILEQQIAQDVVAFAWPAQLSGMLAFWVTPKPGIPVERVEQALDAEFARLIESGITEEELTRARNRAQTSFANELAEFASRADVLSMSATYLGDPRAVLQWPQRYQDIPAALIRDVASTYLDPANRVTVTYVPKAAAPAPAAAGGAR
ncbi:MAG TPA: pitrilysin family protein [Thermoanaerobaculia bacterium]|nr:pitrilysin family protein [Thermoanaerobaculia bacterium]